MLLLGLAEFLPQVLDLVLDLRDFPVDLLDVVQQLLLGRQRNLRAS
jgi:hypothetical protein